MNYRIINLMGKGLAGLLLTLLLASDCLAGMQIVVAPTRIVFDERTRSAQVTLMNSGDTGGPVRISLVNRRMTEAGELVEAKQREPDERFAEKLLRYSPRQVMLEPGQSQVIRLAVRKPGGLSPGEYRSHLLIAELPQQDTLGEEAVDEQGGVKISLKALIGVSIPVIVRHKTQPSSIRFEAARLMAPGGKDEPPYLDMTLLRDGQESSYGEVIAEFVPQKGSPRIIGQISGVAIYTPGTRRTLKLALGLLGDTRLEKGKIKVSYRLPAEQGGQELAATQISLP